MKRVVQVGLVILCLIIVTLAIVVVMADAPEDPPITCRPIDGYPDPDPYPYPYPVEDCRIYFPHIAKSK